MMLGPLQGKVSSQPELGGFSPSRVPTVTISVTVTGNLTPKQRHFVEAVPAGPPPESWPTAICTHSAVRALPRFPAVEERCAS